MTARGAGPYGLASLRYSTPRYWPQWGHTRWGSFCSPQLVQVDLAGGWMR